MGRHITFQLDEDVNKPIYLNLASVILREIERGRLKPGDPLPGTRMLAQSLRLHRNTVDAAYHELLQQGWLVAEPSRGTFVARDLPEIRRPSDGARCALHLRKAASPTQPPDFVLRITDGAPDPRIMPHAELARAFRRALSAPSFLSSTGYGDPRGSALLRTALAEHLIRERGLAVSAGDVLITRGSQMALFLAARAVLEPGQTIAVEDPGYPLAWSAFRAAGARIVGVAVDAYGLLVEDLIRLAAKEPTLKAVYVTPHHQYPTTVTLGAGRRLKLLQLASQLNLTIIEDDYDHEYRFDGRPVLPLAARAEAGLDIIYVGSLSKLLAPGIKLGYAVANPRCLRRMANEREIIDRQGDQPLEHAIASLISNGELSRHIHKARRIYQARRDLFAEEINRKLGDAVAFDRPAGGLAIWLRLTDDSEAGLWARQAGKVGLLVMPSADFTLDEANARNAFRLGYACLNETEIRRAVTLLVQSQPSSIT